jgi:tetratricopeptide (TPR) repeat protein
VKWAPDNIQARRLLGHALEGLGDLEGAVRQYGATLRMAPSDREVEARLRAAERRLAEAQEGAAGDRRASVRGGATGAEPVCRGATEAAGGSPPFSSATLAELYLRQGLAQQAFDVYRRVVAEHPEDERARARLGEIGARLGSEGADQGGMEDRRRALERTIAGLEVLLGMTRRR